MHIAEQDVELKGSNEHQHHEWSRGITEIPAERRPGPGRDRFLSPGRTSLSRARLLALFVRLDDVAYLQVAVVAQGQTTLEALADLGGVVLEPLQRADRQGLRHHGAVPKQTRPGVASDLARGDQATGDGADLRGLEDLADLRLAELDLFELRLEHALQRGFDLVDRLVDHRVVPDVDTLAVGPLGRLALSPHVEAQHDRI